jgi:hypothetical protein
MRSDIDEVATMCGLQCTMNVVLDTRGRVIECIFGAHPDAHRPAIERFNEIYAYEHPGDAGRHRVCGVFAPTDHLFFHTGWGCMSADFVLQDGGHADLRLALAGREHRGRRLPRPGADGPDEAVHAADARELPAGAPRHPRRVDPDVGGLHLGADLRGDDPQAPEAGHARGEPGDGGEIGIDATTSLDEAFAQAMQRHGPDAKVLVLPYARYQLPRNAVRLDAEPVRFPQEAHV